MLTYREAAALTRFLAVPKSTEEEAIRSLSHVAERIGKGASRPDAVFEATEEQLGVIADWIVCDDWDNGRKKTYDKRRESLGLLDDIPLRFWDTYGPPRSHRMDFTVHKDEVWKVLCSCPMCFFFGFRKGSAFCFLAAYPGEVLLFESDCSLATIPAGKYAVSSRIVLAYVDEDGAVSKDGFKPEMEEFADVSPEE